MQNPTITILRIAPGEPPETATILNTLESLQAEVGGTIEAIYPYPEEACLICHGEAKLIGLPLNRALTNEDGRIYDIVAGTFLIAGLSEDDFASLPPELLRSSRNDSPSRCVCSHGRTPHSHSSVRLNRNGQPLFRLFFT